MSVEVLKKKKSKKVDKKKASDSNFLYVCAFKWENCQAGERKIIKKSFFYICLTTININSSRNIYFLIEQTIKC